MEPQNAIKFAGYVDGVIYKATVSDMDAAVRYMFNFIGESIHRLEIYGFKRNQDIVVLIPAIMREHIIQYYRNNMYVYMVDCDSATDIVYDGVKCMQASPDGSVHVYYNKLPLIQPEMRSKYKFSHPIF